MSKKGKNRRKLINLWLQDPHCYYCKRPTVLISVSPKVRMPEEMSRYPLRATLEHLRSKLHHGRTEPVKLGESRIVLACNECNHKQSAKEVLGLSLEEIWERSKKRPKSPAKGNQVEEE